MQFDISVLAVTVSPKKNARGNTYSEAEISYKDLSQNKVNAKKIMDFVNKDIFSKVAEAKTGEVYTVESKKNEKTGYWDWVGLSRSTQSAPSTEAPSRAQASPRSTYETPEERAKKQVYIVRQSSISAAVAMLTPGAKAPIPYEAVVELAQKLTDFVFDANNPETGLLSLPNDIEVE